MYLHFVVDQINYYDTLPVKIRSADGTAYTNLNDMTEQERNAIGLYEYQDITEVYDPLYKTCSNEWQYDHDNRTAVKILTDRDPMSIKTDLLAQLEITQLAIQDAGMTCSNGIKLQTREIDLLRWTQLTATLTAFQPETVTIRDYGNQNHTVTLAEAMQMMGEVAIWGRWFMGDTWNKKDAILNA